jgi:hypothetical protein
MDRRLIAAATLFLTTSTLAHAGPMKFTGNLTGAQQSPEVVSVASGKVAAKFDDGFTRVDVKITMSDITDVTDVHFHCNRPGQNGGVAFSLIPGPPACALAGTSITCTLTNADMTPNSCMTAVGREVNNIAALAFAMRDGLIYANVHTVANPSGEIRGQMR